MILGIDTSNYTTSAALCRDGRIIADRRKPLEVKKGARGLRQSEAFFQHVNNLPELLQGISFSSLRAVCVSDGPRKLPGSYMPCFRAGEDAAKIIADGMGIPLYRVSHQMGHIRAALTGYSGEMPERFLSVHLSGGTTELLSTVRRGADIDTEIIAGTSDISAGQFIDRTGVALGMAFPAGAEMDGIFDREKAISLPVSVREGCPSFSGVDTMLSRLISSGADPVAVCSGAFVCVARSIASMILYGAGLTGLDTVLIAGGVSSGKNIRLLLKEELSGKAELIFAPAGMGSDNACGTALLGEEMLSEEGGGK